MGMGSIQSLWNHQQSDRRTPPPLKLSFSHSQCDKMLVTVDSGNWQRGLLFYLCECKNFTTKPDFLFFLKVIFSLGRIFLEPCRSEDAHPESTESQRALDLNLEAHDLWQSSYLSGPTPLRVQPSLTPSLSYILLSICSCHTADCPCHIIFPLFSPPFSQEQENSLRGGVTSYLTLNTNTQYNVYM